MIIIVNCTRISWFLSCVAITARSEENDVELPNFLTADGGLNSGFMIAHCTSAALGETKCVYE